MEDNSTGTNTAKTAAKPPKKTSTDPNRFVSGLTAIFMVLVSAAAGFAGGWYGSSAQIEDSKDITVSRQNISDEGELVSSIAKEVGASVVSVNVVTERRSNSWFNPGRIAQRSAGTGFIVSDDGIIVTNRHVVDGSNRVSVTLSDGTELEDVELLGQTGQGDSLDIAFLKIRDAKGKDLKPVNLGDSSKIEVGNRVIAIGNALGQFQNTVTTGIISGYGRSVEASSGPGSGTETLQNLFQTDAAINQGNSGGPLVNINGEVIGVNTAVAGAGAENIGFAIPINDMKGLIDSVVDRGTFERSYLGVRYISLTDDYAYELDIDTKRGAYIVPSSEGSPSILKDSPADKAGLKERDIITKVNNDEINEKNSLASAIGRHQPGTEVTLTIVRDGQEQTLTVTLEAAPEG